MGEVPRSPWIQGHFSRGMRPVGHHWHSYGTTIRKSIGWGAVEDMNQAAVASSGVAMWWIDCIETTLGSEYDGVQCRTYQYPISRY